LLIALWVRSYSLGEYLYAPLGNAEAIWVRTSRGHIICKRDKVGHEIGWQFEPNAHEWYLQLALPRDTGVFGSWILDSHVATIPLYFPTLIAATLAAIPWIRRSNRFSLRTLLIATTLVAIVLGLVVWLSR
jgi:hypothetical protein